ncbi:MULTISPECIES: S8 family serine peptidase [unclassified Streptomyces]|uniref:S8 family serine peptidase n=1 Tax=unclassified Streptomyces TaxID=2593676 RepID=UPI0006F646AC|nr:MULTISPECIES: S8 family serine peptidase [unclassified Streptomyces]KQX53074.1 peptidase S8 [Streptomyces sp. Root1304]KRA89995.1 peptidase S8 [Streptomyces sp. Root66D1]
MTSRNAPFDRGRAALIAAGISLVMLSAGQTAAAGTTAPAVPDTFRAAAATGASTTVTLVTGDRVTLTGLGGGKSTVTVDRAKGATGAIRTRTANGRVTVIPDEARPYLDSGALDPRLFDVTGLVEQGVTGDLPLIVTYGAKGARTAAAPRGTETVRALPSIGGAAVTATDPAAFWQGFTARGAARAAAPGKVWLDGRVKAAMAESNAQIGTPKAWEAGLTGKGVKVAVLDTGADLAHPDLAGRVAETKSFIVGQEVADRNGHGTHVSSTVGGSGAGSDGKEKGVAPGATLAVGKVLSDEGYGSESEIIAGMEWAAKDIDAKIVSMSLGSSEPSDGTDPMAQAVNTLSAETGALFVIAAGNSGYPGSIGSPGAADSALTVGAVDSADEAAYFTSQGPRYGDQALKPDLSAPGVDILAARSQLVGGSGLYTSMSGTSMATPHIAGVAALLAEQHPDWTGARLKDALMSSSKTLDASAYALGSGRVDVAAAVSANVTATGSADLGFTAWPYEDSKPVTRTVTYTNSSDAPVELNLSVDGMAAGVATLADTALTVPAHGSAGTTVTGDGTKAPVGQSSGRITATAGGVPVAHTALGLVKEEERYTLTVHVKDRDGAPAPARLGVQKLAEGEDPFPVTVGGSGTLELRLKPGTYTVDTFLDVRGAHGKDSLGLGFLTAPEVTLDRDREITLDGRQLREIRAEVEKRTETRQLLMEFDRDADGASYGGAVQVPPKYDSVFAAPTPKPATGTFEYRTVWRLGKPLLEAAVDGVRLSDATPQAGATLLEGGHRLGLADAGTGTPAEYTGKDVTGKAVLVRLTEGADPVRLAQNAQDAGAKALFVTDDQPGRLMKWFGTADYADRPLAVATVNTADANRLAAAAARGKRVDLTGTRFTPYTYDLSEGHPGAIGTDLVFRPGKDELATIRSTFYAPTGRAELGGEFRYSITDTFPVGFGFKEWIAFPARRTEYVSTGTGQRWHESVDLGDSLEERGGTPSYRGGSRVDLDWFGPVWHPWLGTGLGWGQQRTGNDLRFNTPGWGDSGRDHTGFGNVWNDDSMTQYTEVYVNGVRVDRKKSSGAYAWDAPAEEASYKVVTDTTLDPARWRLAGKGHSEWTFRSAETPSDRSTFLPMLNLGFDVDTDLDGDVRAGSRLPVGISAEYVKGATGTGTITGGTLEVSYDEGATWTGVALKPARQGAAWTGELRIPAGATSVSLRAGASDDRGGSVKQELIRAVGVK